MIRNITTWAILKRMKLKIDKSPKNQVYHGRLVLMLLIVICGVVHGKKCVPAIKLHYIYTILYFIIPFEKKIVKK